MQSALRSATRRAVGISSRRGVATATTTTTKAAAAAATTTTGEPQREWVDEKAWVAAMVQREVRAQMAAEEERRITRDRLRAAAEESARSRRLEDEAKLQARLMTFWADCNLAAMEGWIVGLSLGIVLFAR